MKRCAVQAAVLVAVVFTAASLFASASICDAVAGNLVTNCGFETGDYTGWTHTGTTAYTYVQTDYPNSGTFESKIGPYTYQGLSGISQVVPTTPGEYTLSFYLAHGGDCLGTPDCSEALVQWNGVTLMDELNAVNYPYIQLTFTVNATGPSTLYFGFTSNPNYYYLDDVVVTSGTPEPGTMVLLGSGLIGLARAIRRKK